MLPLKPTHEDEGLTVPVDLKAPRGHFVILGLCTMSSEIWPIGEPYTSLAQAVTVARKQEDEVVSTRVIDDEGAVRWDSDPNHDLFMAARAKLILRL